MQNHFFRSIQVYRGIAALMVAFAHTWNNVRHYYHLDFQWIDLIAQSGKYGVDFFFVLSGFIICYSNYELSGKSYKIIPYLKSRVTRVYIPYLPIGILMLLLYLLFSHASFETRQISIVKSIFLLPVPGSTALSVAWTLVFEMFFYVVFISWFFSKRIFLSVLAVWVLIIIVVNVTMSGTSYSLINFLGSNYNLEFIVGVIAALFYKSAFFNKKVVFGLLGLAIIGLSQFGILHPIVAHLCIGAFFASILLVSLKSFLDKLSTRNIMMILGQASYSIYLIHNPTLSALLLFVKTFPMIHYVLVIILSFLIFTVAGVVYSRIFEQDLIVRVKKISWANFFA